MEQAGTCHSIAKLGPIRSLAFELLQRSLGLLPAFAAARLKTAALRRSGLRIGRTSLFWGVPTFWGHGDLLSRISIGDHCGFNVGCCFELDDEIRIGHHVSVGHEVLFLTRTYDTSDRARRAGVAKSAPIEVGDGAWLGARATILPGVKIGPGAVIGANVVVSKDVPANTLVMGSRRLSLAKWR